MHKSLQMRAFLQINSNFIHFINIIHFTNKLLFQFGMKK